MRERIAISLGIAGLIPFIVLSLGSLLASPDQAERITESLLVYGAVILSFLGGVAWGRLLADDAEYVANTIQHLAYSVTPSLVAWLALLLAERRALLVLASAFIAAFFYDRSLGRAGLYPGWYLRMRLFLTIVVSLSLLAPAISR